MSGARLRRYAPLVALALAAFVVSIVVRHEVLPFRTANRDEPVYLLQAEVLRDGQLTVPAGDRPSSFHPWLHGERDGRFFSAFSPGWPLALAAADGLTGSPGLAMALSAGLVVIGTYLLARELARDHRLALIAAVVVTASPILWLQSAMYVGYLFTLALGLGFAVGALAGLRRRSGWLLTGSGACLGAIFLTRPLDALIWGVPIAGYALITHRTELPRLVRPTLLVAAAALPLVLGSLAYNERVAGSALDFPITAAEPMNGLGFGERRIMPDVEPVHYDLGTAFEAAGTNFKAFPPWAFGGLLGVLMVVAGAVVRRRERSTWLLVALGAAFPVGYLAYWGSTLMAGGAPYVGPQYYIPIFVVGAVFVAAALVAAWERAPVLACVVSVALVGLTVPNAVSKIEDNREFSEAEGPWKQSIERAHLPGRTLVFTETYPAPYLLTSNPFSSNGTDLDGRILWAVDLAGANARLAAAQPDRTAYLQTRELREGDDLLHPSVTVTRLELVRGTGVTIRARVTNPEDAPVVTASLTSGDETRTLVLDQASTRGAVYDATFQLGDGPDAVPAPDAAGEVVLRVTLGASATVDDETTVMERRFDAAPTGPGELGLLAPGRGWRRVVLPDGPRFFRADVNDVIDIDVAPVP